MQRKLKLRELIVKAQNGEEDALNQVVHRFIPLIKKYSSQLGYAEAYSDLVAWVISAVYQYKPSISWGRDELDYYLLSTEDKKK
ncbi:MAG: helix-turn-helix domain-containing protein [Bacillota bacterium]